MNCQRELIQSYHFFYYSSIHDRFYEGERETFDTYIKPTSNPRQHRVKAREQLGNLAVGRTTLIKSGATSIRRRFHDVAVDLPPPPTDSPWASPIVLVDKKDGGVRFCVDNRKLNGVTKFDAYPMPRIEEVL